MRPRAATEAGRIVARAAGVPNATALAIVSLGMIALAISTVLQAIWKGPVGSGYLAVPVFSAIYLAPALLAAKTGGLPAVFGMTMFAGLVEVILSRSLRRLRALFPPAISGWSSRWSASTWGSSASIISSASSTLQVLEHISSAHLVQQGVTRAVVSYDELELLIAIDYEGSLLTLPNGE